MEWLFLSTENYQFGEDKSTNVVTSFTANENSDYLFVEDKKNKTKTPIDYVSVRANTGDSSQWLLYKLDKEADGVVYRIIPALGTLGMSEYDASAE